MSKPKVIIDWEDAIFLQEKKKEQQSKIKHKPTPPPSTKSTSTKNDIAGEKWEVIKDFPDYKVSDWGRVQRKNKFGGWELLHLRGKKNDQLSVSLKHGQERRVLNLKKLVWETFRGKVPGMMWLKHADGDGTNNKLSNIILIPKEIGANSGIKLKSFQYINVYGEKKIKRSKLSIGDMEEIQRLLKAGVSGKRISEMYNISRPYVTLIKKYGFKIINSVKTFYIKSSHERA